MSKKKSGRRVWRGVTTATTVEAQTLSASSHGVAAGAQCLRLNRRGRIPH